MNKFIELTAINNDRILCRVNAITTITECKDHTIICFATGDDSITVKESYDAIIISLIEKAQL